MHKHQPVLTRTTQHHLPHIQMRFPLSLTQTHSLLNVGYTHSLAHMVSRQDGPGNRNHIILSFAPSRLT